MVHHAQRIDSHDVLARRLPRHFCRIRHLGIHSLMRGRSYARHAYDCGFANHEPTDDRSHLFPGVRHIARQLLGRVWICSLRCALFLAVDLLHVVVDW